MRTVLHVGPGYGQRGGVASVIDEVCAWQPAFAQAGIAVMHFPTHGFRSMAGLPLFLLLDVPRFLVHLLRVEVVHLHVSARGSLVRKLCLFTLARLLRKATVFHVHGGDFPDYMQRLPAWLSRVVLRCIDACDAVVTVSHPMAEALRQRCSVREPIRVIPNTAAAFEQRFNTSRPTAPATGYVLFAGRLTRQKGLDELLQAIGILRARGCAPRLCVAGSGNLTHWMRRAHDLGVADLLTWAGWVEGPEKQRLYQDAALFCMPSHHESFGIAALEAMWAGLPVIGTDVGGFPDVVVRGETGWLVPVGDVVAIADAVQHLLSDANAAQRMGMAGRERAAQYFSSRVVLQQYIACYQEIGR